MGSHPLLWQIIFLFYHEDIKGRPNRKTLSNQESLEICFGS